MPITQDNAGVFLPLLCQWLQNSRREGAEGAEQQLCRSAVQKLSEYIQLNFSVDESKLQPGSCGTSDTEICTVYLAQEMRKTEVLGLSFGNIPALGDYGEKRRGGKKRKGPKGPVLDVGCIWVTDLKKNSPAGKCGRVRLKDEILSLNGQLMVGVDVTGARCRLRWELQALHITHHSCHFLWMKCMTLSKIIESQNNLGWKRPLRSSSPTVNPALPGPSLNHIPKHCIYKSSEHLQGR
uniref:Interleukin 16 n=1 Tax=Falco tinnunculus TaxID=100819 RepID=A0A8C4UZ28_FALTI